MKILRCRPTYFDVVYAINPHMKVGSVDKQKATQEWEDLGEIYESIGVQVETLDGAEGFPDMVFTANQSFPWKDASGKKHVALSRMASKERAGEVAFFKEFYEKAGYLIHEMPEHLGTFEGMGDAIWHADGSQIWGGHGYRTKKEVYDWLSQETGKPVVTLALHDPAFYHLDVCLCVLNETTALVYPPAFDEESYAKIQSGFENLIEITKEEAYNFVCNAHAPDQKHVILQQGSPRIEALLKEKAFIPIPLSTAEFIKAGGSVFCMKMDLPA
jgi:N-dimethylarginine dimethylaminohydrolase